MSEGSALPGFGARLRAAMKEANVSSGQLARAVGVTGTTVSRWLNGSRSPEMPQLRLIAQALKRPVSQLIEEELPFVNLITTQVAEREGRMSNADLANLTADVLRQVIDRLRELPEP